MEINYDKYEAVIGLEVHAQLSTQTKAFSPDPYEYGTAPNTQVGDVSMAHPGTLPRPNIEALKYAVKMGIATASEIHPYTFYSRKNYFYPDLPKGYQITQYKNPICTGGRVTINQADGGTRDIRLDKIILEEDSGKSIHDIDPFFSLVDLNRAGVPLIEIVTEPDLRLPEEAYQYLMEIRKMVRYLDICDGNMEEGSLRCDANVSVRLKGSEVLNEKVEIKNMNSMRNVQRAIAYEIKRQIEAVEKGEAIRALTMGFDPVNGQTFEMRSKEAENDYRYFPEPDIPPTQLEEGYVERIKAAMPALPRERMKHYVENMKLSPYDAEILAEERSFADFFEAVVQNGKHYKAAANWMNGPVRSFLNKEALSIKDFPVSASHLAELVALSESDQISFSVASQQLFPALIQNPEANPQKMAEELNLIQIGDEAFLEEVIAEVIASFPEKVKDYQNGKKGLLGMFMGQVMKKTKGKADPKKANQLLARALQN